MKRYRCAGNVPNSRRISQSAADFSAARNPRKTKRTQDHEKNCRRKHDKQQRNAAAHRGRLRCAFCGSKGAQDEVCTLRSAPGSPYFLLSDLPTCLLCRTPRQVHEFSELIFVCKTECAQKKIEKIAAEFGREPSPAQNIHATDVSII